LPERVPLLTHLLLLPAVAGHVDAVSQMFSSPVNNFTLVKFMPAAGAYSWHP